MKSVAMIALCGAAAVASANIVVNGDFQAGVLAPSTSAYTFDNSMFPPATWNLVEFDTIHPAWADFADHTVGGEGGKYMIVNGTDQGLGPAWAQTIAVAPNTDYSVSAWFASLFPEAIASLEFRVDGALIGSGFGSGPVATWEQRSATFNSGNRTSVSIEIWDTNQAFTGNDYAIDDIAVVPAPGALALVGVAGLGVARRRR